MDRPISATTKHQAYKRHVFSSLKWLLPIVALGYLAQAFLSPSIDRSTIRTSVVAKGDIAATINAGGVVIPYSEETLSSEIDSQIVAVVTQQGSYVKTGDVILQLDTQAVKRTIDSISEKMALKDTQIKTKRLQLQKSLNDIDGRYSLLEVDRQSRQARADRLSQLNIAGASSQHELLEAQLNVKRTQLELQQLKQSKLDLASTTDAEIAGLILEKSLLQKDLEEQQRLLDGATVRATRDGVVSWLNNQEGVRITKGESLAKISDNSQFKIEATLSDFYSSQLTPQMPVQIKYNDRVLTGRLASQSPIITDGLMKLMVELDQADDQILKPNLRVDVGFITDTIDNAIQVAKGPFIKGSGRQKVFVIRDDYAYLTDIEVGFSNAQSYQVISGLSEGDEVIISNVDDYLHLTQLSIH
ncbi:MAG: HlyD family efflux transporter periplasmic adaptor subunit [Kangiellaceae bacterium]|jgi:HlyD family secretion protein|nr:HlyD family efflux transporter periplasmic adaptor subunit [Kangiellaceae bacterium]